MPEDQDTGSLQPVLEQLSRTRGRMIWSLSAFLSLFLIGSIYLMTVGAETAAIPIADGSSINFGIIFGASVIIIGAVITAFYVVWANRTLDPLIRRALAARPDADEGSGEDGAK